MTNKTPNRLREYYVFLRDTDSYKHLHCLKAILQDLGITQNSFCRKIANPQSFSPAEKRAIAMVYQQPVHFIFPEMEQLNTAQV